MTSSYRVSRRAFLASVGGAVGLQILLRNLEAAAEGASSPPRFLLTFWPKGTLRQRFLPTGGSTDFQISPILAPFEAAGLREDMIILYGLRHPYAAPSGGGSEAGTVFASTACSSPGTRSNGGESDDAVAGGPSFDQIFLKHALTPSRPGLGFVNATGDARVDSFETSSQCLSYSYERREVTSARDPGMLLTENTPLMPLLAPVDVHAALFSSFMPGQGMQSEATRALRTRKSVLDSALRELARLRELAPSSQREKIDIHADAVRKVEVQIQTALDDNAKPTANCAVPSAPHPDIRGLAGSSFEYGMPKVSRRDDVMLEQVGKLHLALIRAAFQCDLIRAATFQWCPATNHIAFHGLNPEDPQGNYLHHPMTHRIGDPNFFTGAPPAPGSTGYGVYEFLCNAHTWFNQKTADALVEFKDAKDGFGNSLLDHTIVPFVTDTADAADVRSPLPALILGGKKLGMRGGQYQNLSNASYTAMWLAIAQAYFPDRDPAEVLAGEAFMKSSGAVTTPLAGLWQKPA